jgi:hypothetical protein
MLSRRRDFTHNLQQTVYSQPWLHQDDVEVQIFGKVAPHPKLHRQLTPLRPRTHGNEAQLG